MQRQELRKPHTSDGPIASAINANPVLAGVTLAGLDKLAEGIISSETNKSAAMFFGVMLRVGGAAQSLTVFARSVAMPALQKQVMKQALTKTSWYPVVKHCLRFIGINLTKKSFAQGVSKVTPIVGGVISGGRSFVSLQSQSSYFKDHLRELPPPGVDTEVWKQAVAETPSHEQESSALDNAGQALETATGLISTVRRPLRQVSPME